MPGAVLEMIGVSKGFPGVRALADVDFRLFPGEIHALMGENGAGKSTLIKVLTGVYSADAGEVRLGGERVSVTGPQHAQTLGISTVYQEVNLCPNLTVAENVFIGREPSKAGAIRWREIRRRAAELLTRFGVDVDPGARLDTCSLAIQQLVAIVRAVDISAKVLILDEPTSSLDRDEVEQLFTVMRRLRDDGVAILFVSHFLDQVYEVSDRMTVLRNGALVGEYQTARLSRIDLVGHMTGRTLSTLEQLHVRDETARVQAEPVLKADGVGRKGAIAPFDLEIHPGEVVGLAGLLGSGRTEAARLMFGADVADSGTVALGGASVPLRSPNAAIQHGVAFCPENRKSEGLIEDLTVGENIVLALQAANGWLRPLSQAKRQELVGRYMTALRITPADPDMPARNLSGGNQQKVLLARWLITQPKLLILDEPTRGIDVGAKAEIQKLVVSLAEDGVAVLFVSAELEEVLRISHKIEVLRDRRLIAEIGNAASVTPEGILEIIANGTTS
ncbi:sugar ABC transporter ATP-binding protein [Planotetraspora phitsanulokensis]|uniref:Sugar ABC transporter ATP-binding protein n=1 Tax=Planotetraspora phitsanulokensis TaxID=575192 RepID=A0A8J3XFT9_9ACTN|nr:sugar ABC transporter ATP-binding protein [Planotetraspora phitsanulokensis]GII39455.1 sugar ABC transporter ATP-binding protein [Planotetraspora phitsanulokensis]